MTTFTHSDGTMWQIDYDGCLWVLRAYAQARAHVAALRTVEINGLREVRFDAPKFRRMRERFYDREGNAFVQALARNPDDAVRILAAKHTATPAQIEAAQSRSRAAQAYSMHRIASRVATAERTVTALRLTRDISGIVFMSLASGGALGIGAVARVGLLAGGSVFQGVGTYQDTGNIAAGIASANFAFTSSLMAVPAAAGRLAQTVFFIHNTGNTVVRNAAVSYMTAGDRSSTFTQQIGSQLVSQIGSMAAGEIIGDLNTAIAAAVLPVIVDGSQLQGRSAAATAAAIIDMRLPSGERLMDLPAELRQRAMERVFEAQRRQEQAREAEAAWRRTPFYRYLASGDRRDLMSTGEQYVRGNLLRRA